MKSDNSLYVAELDVGSFFATKDNSENIIISSEDKNDGRTEVNFDSFPLTVSTQTFPVQTNTDNDFVNFQMGETLLSVCV